MNDIGKGSIFIRTNKNVKRIPIHSFCAGDVSVRNFHFGAPLFSIVICSLTDTPLAILDADRQILERGLAVELTILTKANHSHLVIVNLLHSLQDRSSAIVDIHLAPRNMNLSADLLCEVL